jgi:penicillin amidase
MGEMIDKVGLEKISGVFPDSTISLYKKEPPVIDTLKTDSLKPLSLREGSSQMSVLGRDFFDANKHYREFFNLGFDFSGSNCWAVSGQRSESGKPILANDPHLIFMAPSRWYEVQLRDGDMDVTGMSFAGCPGIAIGHNRSVCWGITNLMNDDDDFIIYDKVPGDITGYKYKNQNFHLDSLIEKIQVKDSAEIYYTIKYTVQGPVISDLKKRSLVDPGGKDDFYKDKIMTFRWTGFETSDEIFSFYRINKAKNWDEFREALKDFGTPGLNFIYADTAGNIGYHAAGKIPVRKTNSYGYIYPSTDEPEWTGFIEFDRMPSMFNPKEGYLATANTNPFEWMKTDTKSRFYISYGWAPSSRLDKINEYLKIRNRYNVDEFKLLQLDNVSPYAKRITGYIIEAFKGYRTDNREILSALDRLRTWKNDLDKNEPVSAIYNEFLVKLLKNLFLQKFGERTFDDFLLICNLPLCMTERVLSDTSSGWLDYIGGSYREKRDVVIRQSLIEALETLNTRYKNTSLDEWRWGDLHKVKFIHPMGMVSALDKTFNIGPYEVGGDQTTVNNSTYSFVDAYRNDNYDDILGPSIRMITDLADMNHTYSINSTGQSGQPLHPNYEDQSRLWLFGDYKIEVMNESEMKNDKYKLLQLIPQN